MAQPSCSVWCICWASMVWYRTSLCKLKTMVGTNHDMEQLQVEKKRQRFLAIRPRCACTAHNSSRQYVENVIAWKAKAGRLKENYLKPGVTTWSDFQAVFLSSVFIIVIYLNWVPIEECRGYVWLNAGCKSIRWKRVVRSLGNYICASCTCIAMHIKCMAKVYQLCPWMHMSEGYGHSLKNVLGSNPGHDVRYQLSCSIFSF